MISAVEIDVNSKTSVWAAKATIAKELGSEKLYAVVNNAGVLEGGFDAVM